MAAPKKSWEATYPGPRLSRKQDLTDLVGLWTSHLAIRVVKLASVERASLQHTHTNSVRVGPALTAELIDWPN